MDILFFFLLQNAIGGNNRFFSKTLPKIIFGRCYRARIITVVPGTFVIDVSSGFIDFDSAPRLGVLPPMNAAFLGLAFECKRQNALLSFLGQAFGRRCCCYCKREKTKKFNSGFSIEKVPAEETNIWSQQQPKQSISMHFEQLEYTHAQRCLKFEQKMSHSRVVVVVGIGLFVVVSTLLSTTILRGDAGGEPLETVSVKIEKKMIIATATTIAVLALPDAFCKIRQ